jgi:outer membrane protein assembly factor BamB
VAAPLACAWGQERIEGLGELEWYKAIANHTYNYTSNDLERGTDGSIYYAGSYAQSLGIGSIYRADTTFVDTINHSPYIESGFVAKLDEAGNFQWAWILHGDSGSTSHIRDIQPTENGDLWIFGEFAGTLFYATGASLQSPSIHQPNGFLAKLSSRGEVVSMKKIGSNGVLLAGKLFPQNNGEVQLVISNCVFPIIMEEDTIIGDSLSSFMTVIKLNSDGKVRRWGSFYGLAMSEARYIQSAIDSQGNTLLEFRVNGIPSWEPGSVSYRGLQITSQGYHIAKLDSNLDLIWVEPLITQPNGVNALEVSTSGEIYVASNDRYTNQAFLEKYDVDGSQIWNVSTSGSNVSSQDIYISKDAIYWAGYYQCEIQIDTLSFQIGVGTPCTWPAREGFICMLNQHSGRVGWLMSLENKHFSKILAVVDDFAVMAAQVNSPNCTVDTLAILNIAPSVLPYTLLFRLGGLPKFPMIPEKPVLRDSFMEFMISPNPSAGVITIQTTKAWSDDLVLEIYDMLGQRLMRGMLHKTAMPIDLGLVSSQTLLVRLVDEEGKRQIVRRLVLRK